MRGRAAGPTLALAAVAACAPAQRPVAPPALAIAVPYDLNGLDPHARDKLGSFSILSNIYEPLVTAEEDLKVRPCLAQSWENPDLATWVFHLRPGVAFHDGRMLRAADVVYSFRRILASDALEMKTYLLDVADVAALDERTVRIRTRGVARSLLNKISSILVIPEGETGDTLRNRASGTGPYSLEAADGDRVVRLRRNPQYWHGTPALEQVAFFLGSGAEEATQGLLDGRYRLIQCDSRKAEATLEAAGRFRLVRRANLYVKYLGYDLARNATPFCAAGSNPFRRKAVRQAIHLALDRHALVAALSSHAVPATQPVPRFVFGFDPAIPEAAFDLSRARALLRGAGFPRGFPVVLHVRNVVAEAAGLVRDQLAGIGIAVEVRALPDKDFYDLVDRREVSFYLNRFGCPTGDASDILDDVVHSLDRARHLGVRNFGGYADPELDAAIEASAALDPVGGRRKELQQILARVMEELPLIPLYNDEDVYAMDRSLAFEPRSDSVVRAAEIRAAP